MLKSLDGGRVDIWLMEPEPINGLLKDRLASCLTSEEQQRIDRFVRTEDRELHFAARVMLRHVLSRYADILPMQWRFGTNAYGKPFISNELPEPLYFNVSHTRGLIACAVGRVQHLGVDVECVDKSVEPLRLASSVFADQEVRSLEQVPSEEQTTLFFRYWTLKEAYIKAVGMGLSHPLDTFWFELGELPNIQFNAGTMPEHIHHHFMQCPQGNRHMLAAAVALDAERSMRFEKIPTRLDALLLA